jgi:hypothetical protein
MPGFGNIFEIWTKSTMCENCLFLTKRMHSNLIIHVLPQVFIKQSICISTLLKAHLAGVTTELDIYLEHELQSFGLGEKWSQDGGHWRPIIEIINNTKFYNLYASNSHEGRKQFQYHFLQLIPTFLSVSKSRGSRVESKGRESRVKVESKSRESRVKVESRE